MVGSGVFKPGFYGLIILSALLNACIAPRNITIQVLTSPDTMLFSQEHDLLLMNSLFLREDLEDTLTFDDLRLPTPVYNQLTWRAMYGFADVASGSPLVKTVLFDSVRLIPGYSSVYHSVQAKHAAQNHTPVSVRLDSLVFGDTLMKKQSLAVDGTSGLFLVEVNLILPLRATWDVYRLGKGVYTFEVQDTFILDGVGLSVSEAVANLPDIKENVYDLTYHTGNKSAFFIYPTWEDVNRVYYIHQTNKMMVMAEKAASENNWFKAAEIWSDLTKSKNKSLAAHAAFNMAVASEINDLLDVAEQWLITSMQLKPSKMTKEYLDVIRTRIKEKKKMVQTVPEPG